VPPRTAPDIEQHVVELYHEGERAQQIAGRAKVSVGTVYAILARHKRSPNRTSPPWRQPQS
jgi:hypothetical protein